MAVLYSQTVDDGGSEGFNSRQPRGWMFVATASGTATTVTFKGNVATANLKLALYSDNGTNDRPASLLASSTTSVTVVADTLHTLTLDSGVPLVSGTKYHAVFKTDQSTAALASNSAASTPENFSGVDTNYSDAFDTTWAHAGASTGTAPYLVIESADAPPTISDVDGDNAVTQYQLALINVSDFTETITSVTINGVACTIAENDPTDDVTQIRFPGSVATGSYDVVVSGATETDTISGVGMTQTYPIVAPEEMNPGGTGCDSNSIWKNQGWAETDEVVYWDGPALPADWVWIDPYTGWDDAPTAQDVNDYLEPPEGFEGTETLTFTRIYSDATVTTWDVELTVQDGVVSVGVGRIGFIKSIARSIVRSIKESIRS